MRAGGNGDRKEDLEFIRRVCDDASGSEACHVSLRRVTGDSSSVSDGWF